MKIEQATLEAFSFYKNTLEHYNVIPMNQSTLDFSNLSESNRLSHALWMCNEILDKKNSHYSLDKRSRWLGFVQAILICSKTVPITISDERERTRPWFNPAQEN